jgi:putative hemolysin
MNKALLWVIIILVVIIGIYYFINTNNQAYAPDETPNNQIVGGDKDEHGCIPSAGYTWCESKQKCLRTWEEECPNTNTQIANPASVNCTDQGGTLEIKDGPAGEYGICYFEDNRQCEEWALFNGNCPVGGMKITGYDNDAQIYCAIRGGQVDMDANTCTLPDETVCDIDAYYNGNCPE